MKRVLVIGASGLLGQYVAMEASRRGHEVLGTFHHNGIEGFRFSVLKLDITRREEVDGVVDGFEPDWVVLASAMTDVDGCQRYPDRAFSVNVEGTFNVASACRSAGVKLLYLSTDYVFNGTKGGFYTEEDIPDPQSIYAQTKYEGESVTLDASQDNLVCRVSVLFGWNRVSGKHNFVTWLIEALEAGRTVSLFADQRVSPTYAPACSRALIDLLDSGAHGIFHTSGRDCVSRYGMGAVVASVFGLDTSLIRESSMDEAHWLAPRPRRSCLDVRKAEAWLNRSLSTLQPSLEEMREAREG